MGEEICMLYTHYTFHIEYIAYFAIICKFIY